MNEENLNSLKKSREIVQEILRYGVNQDDIINIIKNLSLELEDISLMKNINDLILHKHSSENNENIVKEKIQI